MKKVVDEIVTAVKEMLGEGYSIEAKNIAKNNGCSKTALIIHGQDSAIAPAYYIDGALDRVEEGRATAIDIARELVAEYRKNEGPGFDVKKIAQREFVLEHLSCRVFNADTNQAYIESNMTFRFLDLVCVFYCNINEEMSYAIKKEFFETLDISEEQLKEIAMENIRKNGISIMGISNFFNDQYGFVPVTGTIVNEDDEDMYVVINEERAFAANSMMITEWWQEFAKKKNSDLFILPSSIHELLIVPTNKSIEVEQLREMVMTVNDTQLKEEEILSYNVYRYDLEKNEISIA